MQPFRSGWRNRIPLDCNTFTSHEGGDCMSHMTLHETCENWNESLNVDRENRLVLNVALSGQLSRNGYTYSHEALAAAATLYENKPVFLDHASQRLRPLERSTRDLVGSITNPRYISGRIRGDIRVLDTESGQTFLKLVESHTPGVGMSHVVLADRTSDGKTVQKIVEVISVDVVINPATTSTFAESAPLLPIEACPGEDCSTCVLLREKSEGLQAERDRLQSDIHRLQKELQGIADRESVRALIAESGLPAESVSECFQNQLLEAATMEQRRQLLQDRLKLLSLGHRDQVRPFSQARCLPSSLRSTQEDEFVRILKRR